MASFEQPWSQPQSKHIYYLKDGSIDERDILGLKGANLCEMYRIGLPVPPAFTITSKCCFNYRTEKELSKELFDEIRTAIHKLENKTGKKFGSVSGNEKPLLLSVRSSSAVAMPGLMMTVLNLGMNKRIVQALTEQSNNGRWALSTYMKFLETFGVVVKGVNPERYEEVRREAMRKRATPLQGPFSVDALSVEEMLDMLEKFKLMAPIPGDPWEQLSQCVQAAFRSWFSPRAVTYRDVHNIAEAFGAAVTVQAMVFGNLNNQSGAGTMSTRHPQTGEKKLYGHFLANAEGDEVVSRKRIPAPLEDLRTEHPAVFARLKEAANSLERHYKDAQEVEFTLENLQVHVLETHRAPRSDIAAVRIPVDMVRENLLSEREALLRVDPQQLGRFAFPMVQDEYWSYQATQLPERILGRGEAAGGGAVVGKLVFTSERAEEWWKEGEDSILCLREAGAQHLEGMRAAAGVITQEGGITSFAATTMRAMGKAAVASLRDCDADWENRTLTARNQERSCLREGDTVTIDGATGLIYIGQKPITLANQDENFQTVMYWADRYKRLSVYSTAASVHDVTTAKRLGAEGIELFRAEQFLLKEGRTDLFLKFILVEDELERQGYMTQLQPLVYSDFLALYNQLGNSNVSVLLLDTPLSEFLPSVKSVDFERDLASLAERLQLPVESCRNRIHALQSANPVMGLRGCRLSVMHPQITETLTKAIVGAAVEMSRGNFPVLPKIVVPCSFSEQEVDRVASLVTTVSDTICARAWDLASSDIQVLPSKVAVLVETPRACYKTAAIVRVRGVSDILVNSDAITDMVFGMHEDCSQGFMRTYLGHHMLAEDPFQVLDEGGVGSMIISSVQRAQRSGADVKVGITGKHTGHTGSIVFFECIGADYLCCAPDRVPVAKVAAAQARILTDMKKTGRQPAYKIS